MSPELFQEKLELMCKWFKKSMDEDQAQILYERIRFIPDEAFREIVDQMIETMKYFPLINDFKMAWRDWISQNPTKIIDPDQLIQEECSECGGTGMLDVWVHPPESVYKGEKLWYSIPFPCGFCNNWKRIFTTKKTFKRADIIKLCEKKGWEVSFEDPYRVKKEEKDFERIPIPEMANMAVKDLNQEVGEEGGYQL